MRVTWMHSGDDGESHFTDLDLPQLIAPNGAWFVDFIPAEGVSLRMSPVAELDYHRAPRRQLVIVLGGETEVEVASGERRVFGPGEALLADDTEGHGHITRRSEPGLTVWVSLPKSLDLSQWRAQP